MSEFVFKNYSFDKSSGEIRLVYQLDGISFTETFIVPISGVNWSSVPDEDIERALFSLHLITGISYWKAKCPKKIVINSGTLTREQAHFWNTLYTKGLGQFFYQNDIDFRNLIHFPYESKGPNVSIPQFLNSSIPSPLVPLGGGKDSIVTAEKLKDAKVNFTTFAVGNAAPIAKTAEAIGASHFTVERTIDPELIALNDKSETYNGHIPISAIWSFLSVVIALVHQKTDVIFSWEQSASSGNLGYLGETINHQYSKSLEFERSLQAYSSSFVTNRVRVFSLLRPFSELSIVKEFVKHPKYFSIFSSCNKNFRTNSSIPQFLNSSFWCGSCPKCAFVFTLLSAWLPHEAVVGILGHDLFENKDLLQTFGELAGTIGTKPFECVGEPDEVISALELIYRRGDANNTKIMQWYASVVRPTVNDMDEVITRVLAPSGDNAVPEDYKTPLNL